jgi:hypothetical protein
VRWRGRGVRVGVGITIERRDGVGLGSDSVQRRKKALTSGPALSVRRRRCGRTPSDPARVGRGLLRQLGQIGSPGPFFLF